MGASAEQLRRLDALAHQVRRETSEWFGFEGRQARLLKGLCGEVSVRLARRLGELEKEAWTLKLKLGGECAHFVVLCGDALLDGTITQFEAEEFRKYLRAERVPEGRFAFEAEWLKRAVEEGGTPSVEDYPVGPVTSARFEQPEEHSIYASRGYMLYSFATRFGRGGGGEAGISALRAAMSSGDSEWRRSVAAALGDFDEAGAAELARSALEDADAMVREFARMSLEALRKRGG